MVYLISQGQMDFLHGLPLGLVLTWVVAIIVAFLVLRFVLRLVKKLVGVFLILGFIAILGGSGLGLFTGIIG